MTHGSEQCEACRRNNVEVLADDDDALQPYRVCAACARRLRRRSLRPLEWFNLAAIHCPAKHLLHDDFYWDNGKAQQPEEEVEAPEQYPAPTLEQVSHDPDRLLDYAMTLYFLDVPTLVAVGRHDRHAILEALKHRVTAYPNVEIEATAYAICARILGSVAETWIRERWSAWNPTTFYSLAEATAACLPFEEGFGRVAQVFEEEVSLSRLQQDRYGLGIHCHAFAPFHSRKTLDWMEAHTPILGKHEPWGRVAAQSHFSWPRAVCWLDRGRPLSHIALYAMQACYHYDTRTLQDYRPVLEETPPFEEVQARLAAHYEADHVPTVRILMGSIGRLMTSDKQRGSE